MRLAKTSDQQAGTQNQQKPDARSSRRRTGDEAETQALEYLQKAGLTLLQRNFLCKGGEIDLVMQHGQVLVFVEVRKRSSMQFGGAVASVTPAKQRRMVHAAQVYLLGHFRSTAAQPACRFDVIAIDEDRINWLQNVIVA